MPGEISQKLLTMADARKNVFRPERVKLTELAAHLRATYPTLETEIEWDALTADRALLLSMLGNLIGNAVKAAAPGAPVKMRATPDLIEIVDTGAGMTESTQNVAGITIRSVGSMTTGGVGAGGVNALHDALQIDSYHLLRAVGLQTTQYGTVGHGLGRQSGCPLQEALYAEDLLAKLV